jgi:uncharacterized protein (DUF1800 family)
MPASSPPAPLHPARLVRTALSLSHQRIIATCLAVVLASCGGGNGSQTTTSSDPDSKLLVSAGMVPASNGETYRFLTQTTFGPTSADVARVNKIGYDNWIDEQFALQLQTTHLQTVMAAAAARGMVDPPAATMTYSWWTHAMQDQAQLRQRVAFALSEIFVVSNNGVDTRSVASYLDMLTQKSDSTYRDLIEAVALHPAMGAYLSHLANRKEDPASGRVPDENFARELMQLFSIGLYELDDSAHPRLVNQKFVESYTADDIKGMAKVFTGWGWYWPAEKSSVPWWRCFWRAVECQDDRQFSTSMSPYNIEHSVSTKQFLGVTVLPQTAADAKASLKMALDRLASHNNTAPFISKQLIQRLVTSNPSDAYVSDITHVFRQSGGNLRAVIKAILLHAEARHPDSTVADMRNFGKLREPVLRLAHLLRVLPHTSDDYATTQLVYLAGDTDNAATTLGQTPMRSPSVFNFFRPGYTPPQTSLSAASLVSPEMQITNETSVLGYANFLATVLDQGWGDWNSTSRRMDIQFDLSSWDAMATQPTSLVKAISTRLLGTDAPDDVAQAAVTALNAMPSNTAKTRRQRVQAAILMIAVSPRFLVQQ